MTKTTTTTSPSTTMILLTRVYAAKDARGRATTKNQRIYVNAAEVVSFRPRSKVQGQKAALVLTSKPLVNVAESFEQIKAKLATAGVTFA